MLLAHRVVAVAVVASFSIVAHAEPTAACSDASPKTVPTTHARKLEPSVQTIEVLCGTQNATQALSPTPAASSSPHESAPSFNWDKVIEAFFKFLASIGWPIAAVYIAYTFRKELAALLARLKKGKWGSAEFEFENYVREVDAEADIPRTQEAESISPSAAARASTDPRGAIVTAWIDVEDALFELVRSRQLSEVGPTSKPNRGTVWAIRAVQKAQALDASWVALFHDLRAMRNEAAHSTDFSPPPESVIKYVQLAKELAGAMRNAAAG